MPGPAFLGAIANTNSDGRFDLLVYHDGILAVPGSYWGTVLMGASAGAGAGLANAAASGLGAGAGSGVASAHDRERIAKLTAVPRAELLGRDRVVFYADDSIVSASLTKRWHGHSLDVALGAGETRTFRWKPAMNRFDLVASTLRLLLGARLQLV